MDNREDMIKMAQNIDKFRSDLMTEYDESKDYIKDHNLKNLDNLIQVTIREMTNDLRTLEQKLNGF